MKWFAETTNWANAAIPNGVYLLNDSKSRMYAFRSRGTGDIKIFKNPIRIDIRGRKFVINPEQYPTSITEPVPQGRVWTVKGSKGLEYKVSELDGKYACTCPGFKFRGQCRHIESVK